VLGEFLGRQRAVAAGIAAEMLPAIDAAADVLAGGKRLRPAFCYWGWRGAGGVDGPEILAAAAALELLHAGALVHDDVLDDSDTRRGRPTIHRRFAARHAAAGWRGTAAPFGRGVAILLGDLLLAWTDELFGGSGLPEAALSRGRAVLDAMRTELMAGQYLDLLEQAAGPGSVADALRVVTYKTAKYTIERPLHLGAAMAGAGEAVAAVCTDYGIPLGTAFQLRDDILGIFGDPAITGKPVTGDISEGKRTVLMALATERANSAQLRVLDRYVGDRRLTEAGAAEVRAVITDTGALDECETLIDASVKEATAALDGALITEEAREALTELAVLSTARAD